MSHTRPVHPMRFRRGMARTAIVIFSVFTGAITLILLVALTGGAQNDARQAAPFASSDPASPVVQPSEDSGELLEKLLQAIDRRDIPSVKAYADALFASRRDLDIQPAILRLRDPALRAVGSGDVDLARALASAGAVFTAPDTRGRNALHIAAGLDQDGMVRFLVREIGIGPEAAVVTTQKTAMHLAVESGATKAIAALATLGADPNARSAGGKTPLIAGAEAGNLAGVQALLGPGLGAARLADPNAQDHSGATALHAAAAAGRVDIANLLLRHAADPSVKDASGRTPRDVAHARAHDDLTRLLDNPALRR